MLRIPLLPEQQTNDVGKISGAAWEEILGKSYKEQQTDQAARLGRGKREKTQVRYCKYKKSTTAAGGYGAWVVVLWRYWIGGSVDFLGGFCSFFGFDFLRAFVRKGSIFMWTSMPEGAAAAAAVYLQAAVRATATSILHATTPYTQEGIWHKPTCCALVFLSFFFASPLSWGVCSP